MSFLRHFLRHILEKHDVKNSWRIFWFGDEGKGVFVGDFFDEGAWEFAEEEVDESGVGARIAELFEEKRDEMFKGR